MVEEKESIKEAAMKTQKGLYILIGVLLVMVGVYIGAAKLNEHNQNKEITKAQDEKMQITDISGINKFGYTNGTETMSFEKEGDQWKVTGNTDFPLSQSEVESMEGLAGNLMAVRQLENMDELSDYGLTSPQYTLSMTGGDQKEVKLLIGNAAGEDYYAMVDGEDTVYTIDSSLVGALKFSLDDLIQLETFPTIGQANLKKVTITKGDTVTQYKSSNDDNTESISTIAGGLGAVYVESCVNYNADEAALAACGLSEVDRTKVEVVYKDNDTKEKTTFVFYVGATTEDGASQYLQMDGSKMINQVSAAAMANVLGGD